MQTTQTPTHIPTRMNRYGDGLESETIAITGTRRAALTTHIGVVPEGQEARQTHGGPKVPGPWAFCVQHAMVIDNHGGSGREHDEAPIRIEIGSLVTVEGLPGLWRIENRDQSRLEGEGVKLVEVEEEASTAPTTCQCESSLCYYGCDEARCMRPIDSRFRVEYLEGLCLECAVQMGITGGEAYLHLSDAFEAELEADAHRRQAAQHEQNAADSFERSDTDGFLSQWASGINAQVERAKAAIVEAGGIATFYTYELRDLDGELVPAKLIDGQFGPCWALLDEAGDFTGTFIGAHPKRVSTLERKGYREERVAFVAPATADTHGSGRGLAGAASVQVITRPKGPDAPRWDGLVGLGDRLEEFNS